jgi:hypothetical protein
VSVSTQLDQLLNESFVADLGYPADQSTVARVVRGLQLLADEIDALAAQITRDPLDQDRPSSVVPEHGESECGPAEAQPAQSPTAAPDAPTAKMNHDSPIGVE